PYGDMATPSTTSGAFNGCGSGMFGNIDSSSSTDLWQIPPTDSYGNMLWGAGSGVGKDGYKNSHIVGGNATTVYNGTDLNKAQPSNAYHMELPIWNGVDSTANNIRNDSNLASRAGDLQNMAVAIYTIGYTGNGGVDDGLLKRVANDKTSTAYNATQQTG